MAKRRRKLTAVGTKKTATKKKKIKLNIEKSTLREIWGVFFAVLGILSALALGYQLGVFGQGLALVLISLFGIGAYIFPIVLLFLSLAFFVYKKVAFDYTRFLGIIILLLGLMGFVHTFLPEDQLLEMSSDGGGYVGFASSVFFIKYIGFVGARVVLFALFLVGLLLTFPFSLTAFLNGVMAFVGAILKKEKKKKDEKPKKVKFIASDEERKKAEQKRKKFEKEMLNKEEKEPSKPLIAKPKEGWEPPDLDLLSNERADIDVDDKKLTQKAELIGEKLLEFGVEVSMGKYYQGPTVTQFTLKPAEGVKLTKITNLKNDLALALSARSIRIEAPIPGKDLVGIETPNEKRTMVRLREILESSEFDKLGGSLRLGLGRDVSGDAVAFDLAKMPHLLIAGATGAGKSVGMNSFLLSLLFQNSPADLKMILIDPKRVELASFNGLPHLLTPVITEAEQALSALRWAVAEMMRRYNEMSEKRCRNIEEYNKQAEEKMPKIVIVIDELADLMMRQHKKETEGVICRIAQMARAVGMHLIVATQRPSVDVITGLIKANIPARIAYAVTSSVDSRTIIDSIGAEDLLGGGDLLFTNASLGRPLRVQGVFISSEEIQRVTNRIKLTTEADYDDTILNAPKGNAPVGIGSGEGSGDDDDLLEEAIEVIRSSKKASASLLQRRLSVGYARAARILDILEERGMIGPARGAKPRDIYL